ncbi:MAG: BACON domain-containing carbohydrate-binding protein, partial [Mangrovibacterium sp.]|nr:BACON domain-containing carbohydrate-binding protein [Mangrovibacterium sp.]
MQRTIAVCTLSFCLVAGVLRSEANSFSAGDCLLLGVFPFSQTVSDQGGSLTFYLLAWGTSCEPVFEGVPSWMTVSCSNLVVHVAVQANNGVGRSAVITLRIGSSQRSFTVVQQGEEPHLTLSPASLSFSSSGGSQAVTISTNTQSQSVSYTGCVSNAVISGNMVTVTCEANATTSARSGTVTVSGGGISSGVSVVQAPSSPYITLSPAGLSFIHTGGNQSFTISTNTTSQSVSYSGCVSSVTRSGNRVTVNCGANSTSSERTGTVTVSGDGISSVVNVTQSGVPYITLSPSGLSFAESGGNQTVTMDTNTASQSVTYSGCVSGATLSGNTITVTCSPNYSTSAKTGTVTVTGGGTSSVINVVQAASAPYITLIPDTLNFSSSGGVRVFTVLTNVEDPDVSFSGCVDYARKVLAVVLVTCEANSATSERTGRVTVSGEGISSTVRVVQAAAEPYITLSPDELVFPSGGGSQTFTISSNVSPRGLSYSNWISGVAKNGNTVTVTCGVNESSSERTGTVSVFEGELRSEVTIRQEAVTSSITLTPGSLTFTAGGEAKSVSVTSSVSWAVTDNQSWITTSPSSGTGNGAVSITCTANSGTSSRSGTVTFTGGGITQTVTVTQEAARSLSVSPAGLTFTAGGEAKSVSVTSSVPWTVTDNQSWITATPSSGTGNGTVSVNCAANSGSSSRSGTVTFTGGGITQTVTVTQEAAEVVSYLTVLPGRLNFSSAGGTKACMLSTNTSSQTVTYTGCVTGASVTGGTVNITCSANNGYSSRTGSVTVTGSGITFTVGVTQGALPGSPGSARNYIKTETVLEKGIGSQAELDGLDYDRKRTRVEYYDGLGRLSQVNDYRGSANGAKDLITPVVYDAFGRQAKDYLPFSSEQNMAYHPTPTNSANWAGHYEASDLPYTYGEKTFDNSPLNRVMEQSAPGNTWRAGSGHTLKYDYGTNSANDVILFVIDNSTGLLVLSAHVYYPAN